MGTKLTQMFVCLFDPPKPQYFTCARRHRKSRGPYPLKVTVPRRGERDPLDVELEQMERGEEVFVSTNSCKIQHRKNKVHSNNLDNEPHKLQQAQRVRWSKHESAGRREIRSVH